MNAIVQFELCTLTNEELVQKVDQLTDQIYQTGKIPSRYIPARPNDDYDLLVGELCRRYLKVIDPSPVEQQDTITEQAEVSEQAEKVVAAEKMMQVLSYSISKGPIAKLGCPKGVPMWRFNEEWAQRIHGQSLDRLNERGGLSPSEMMANITKGDPTRISEETAVRYLIKLLS